MDFGLVGRGGYEEGEEEEDGDEEGNDKGPAWETMAENIVVARRMIERWRCMLVEIIDLVDAALGDAMNVGLEVK